VSATGGGGSITVTDTSSVDLTLTGTNLSAAVKRDPEATNLLAIGAPGLDVSTEAVQDAIGTAMNNGLAYDDAAGKYNVRPSADASNEASISINDGGLWIPPARTALRRAKGAVAFTWDDGWDSHPLLANMHAARHQRATFYVTSNLLGTSQHMAAAAMAPMVAQGHEIGSHSADHLDMTTLTPVTRAAQWAASSTLEAIIGGGYKIKSYAYPFGNNNLTTNQEAYGRFDRIATISLSQGYYTSTSGYGPYLYESTFEGFKHGRFPWSQTTHAQFMALLRDYVAKRSVVLPAYAHQVGNPDTPTLVQITEAMDFCVANGIQCITEREAFPGPKVVNAGFEDGIDGLDAWTIITAGTVGNTAVVDVIVDPPSAGLAGSKSLRITAPPGMTSADSVHVFQTVPVTPNMAYSISGRVRHDLTPVGAGKFSVRINEYNEAAGTIAGRSVRGSASTAAWAQSSGTPAADAVNYVVAGRTSGDARLITVGFYVQEFSGVFYGDHLAFFPTEEGLIG
jgi:peptidoglycan/xylan/chitin deacetylase (PgdA/CDA1 family)